MPERAWRQYLLRVAYLALTRILLYRAWEDVQFVESYLYDGGFDEAYVQLSEDVERVLDEAFHHGADQYRELFSADSNYAWYRPREQTLVDVLYLLAPQPLGKLDADVLGELYVSYVDEIDRDRLGQFFTPRPVVRFMLDRAGFSGTDVFRVEGDTRAPRLVLDFATGSGGFLVEAARRIIDEGGLGDDVKSLYEGLAAITTGFVGGEISPFPYYLTEINVLLQISRLLGRLRQHGERPHSFTLGVLHIDTLTAKSQSAESLDVDPKLRKDHAELTERGFDLAQLDDEKRERFRELRKDGGFDLVVGNPPYVAEANNKPLFDRLKSIGAWRGIYRGKTDYSYYFLYLAVEKLAPGGRLAVIVPAGWMNAGAADFLREKLVTELRLDELFLFGAYRLFAADQGPAQTPTVESAILVATKAKASESHQMRVVLLENEKKWPQRDELLAEMAKRLKGKPGRRDGIFVHEVPQSELRPEHPWPVKFGTEDVPARVVAHLQKLLDNESVAIEPLDSAWKVFQGIQTGADAYTRRIDKRLTVEQRAALAVGLKIGDPILELPAGTEKLEPWKNNPSILARSPESRGILYGTFDSDDYTLLVRLTKDAPPPQAVVDELEPWKPLLASRAEIARNPKRNWWEAAWPRSSVDLKKPKVVALYRTDRGRFALDATGDWQPSIKTTIVVGKQDNAPVAYLCGLLNSELIDLWYAVRGKTPWHVRRNYEPMRMNEIPYRRPDGNPRAEEIAELVRHIARNRQSLLPHRSVIRDLKRTVKDPWKDGPVVADDVALIAQLPGAATVSVRIDAALHVTGEPVGKATRTSPGVLAFRRGGRETGRVEGEGARVDLLERVLGGKATDDAGTLVLPKSLDDYASTKEALLSEVSGLLARGRELVEKVERLVCVLYDVPDDFTEAVVENAVGRAQSSQPAED